MTAEEGLLLTNTELEALHDLLEPAGVLPDDTQLERKTFRSIFVSDTHIGRHDCKADKLTTWLDLAKVEKTAYFVGDIVDYWLFRASRPHHLGRIFKDDTQFRTGLRLFQYGLHFAFRAAKIDVMKPREAQMMRWPQAHNDPLQKIFRLIRKARAILIGGNHDELLRGFTNELHRMGMDAAVLDKGQLPSRALRDAYFKSPSLGNLDLLDEVVHVTMGGEHLHVCHADRFDPPMKKSRALGIFATRAFHKGVVPLMRGSGFKISAQQLTEYVNTMDGKKDLTAFYDRYADFLDKENDKIRAYNASRARDEQRPLLRGGIHGHVHNPGIRHHRGYVFMDSGDWVDDSHCTSLVEHTNGTWQIMTVDRIKGIHPHPVTPEPIQLFAARREISLIPYVVRVREAARHAAQ